MAIFFVIIILVIIFLSSSLKISIEDFKIYNKKITNLKIIISIAFLNEINLLQITLNKEKIENLKKNKIIKKIIKKVQEEILKDYTNENKIKVNKIKEGLKSLKYVSIKNIKIKGKVGTANAVITAFLTTFLNLFITFFIARKVNNTKYEILPVYIDENYFELSIKCIISIKVVHIIRIARLLKRKESDKIDGRTSNRRSYANSHG